MNKRPTLIPIGTPAWWKTDEAAYAALADEMNDPDVPSSDWEHLDTAAKERAARFAVAWEFPFPPSTGDYDRWFDWAMNEGRRG